jgi:glycerophosphoryl diester phosphodiesterase
VSLNARPLLLGHRGVRPIPLTGVPRPDLPAENTIAAFDYALAHGCDGFEFDVRFTRDRHSVICHDSHFDGREILTTDYADLERDGSHPPRLEDVLARFGHAAYLDIELKVSGNEELVVAALRANPPARGFVLSSFLPQVLLALRSLDPTLPLGFICDRPEYMQIWTALPISILIPRDDPDLLTAELVDELHGHGLKLFSWTVNLESDLLRLATWGVDGLISDDPTALVRTFCPPAG